MKLFSYLLIFTTIFGCSQQSIVQDKLLEEEPTPVEETIKLDTLSIQKQIIKSLKELYKSDTLNEPTEENFFFIDTILKVNLTPDSIRDYFILTANGTWPLYQGYFFNGATGNKITVDSTYLEHPISRFSMSYNILKTNCNSLKNSIVTGTTATGCYGESVELYSYNPKNQQMEITLNLETAKGCFSEIKGVFYSNAFSGNLNNCDTIKVFYGENIGGSKNYLFQNIRKVGTKPLETYTFNEKSFRWEKNVW